MIQIWGLKERNSRYLKKSQEQKENASHPATSSDFILVENVYTTKANGSFKLRTFDIVHKNLGWMCLINSWLFGGKHR